MTDTQRPLPHGVIRLRDHPHTHGLDWLWEGFVPVGFPTSLFGEGGTGKSLIALALAVHVATGRPFLRRRVIKGPVLYIDAEMDKDEHRRRLADITVGMGLDEPPDALYYRQLGGMLMKETAGISHAIAQLRPVLVILDSFSVASGGSDPNSAGEVISALQAVRQWGTTLLIDHMAKNRSVRAAPSAFGSAFKGNLVRSAIHVEGAGDFVTFEQVKSNFGRCGPPLRINIQRQHGVIAFAQGEAPNKPTRRPLPRPLPDRILETLEAGPDGKTAAEVAHELGVVQKTVQNTISKLKNDGLIEANRGRWRLVSE